MIISQMKHCGCTTVCGVEDSAGEGEKTEAAVVWASGGMKTTQ